MLRTNSARIVILTILLALIAFSAVLLYVLDVLGSGWAVAALVLALTLMWLGLTRGRIRLIIFPLLLAAALFLIVYLFLVSHHNDDIAIRKHIGEGLSLAASIKTQVHTYYDEHHKFPGSHFAFDPATVGGRNAAKVYVQHGGTIVIVYQGLANGSLLAGKELHLVPSVNIDTGQLSWKCVSTDIASEYLPGHCRN